MTGRSWLQQSAGCWGRRCRERPHAAATQRLHEPWRKSSSHVCVLEGKTQSTKSILGENNRSTTATGGQQEARGRISSPFLLSFLSHSSSPLHLPHLLLSLFTFLPLFFPLLISCYFIPSHLLLISSPLSFLFFCFLLFYHHISNAFFLPLTHLSPFISTRLLIFLFRSYFSSPCLISSCLSITFSLVIWKL